MDKYQRSFDMRSANHFTTSNTPFDFDSILMSGPTDFGKSGMTTIQSLIPGVEIRLQVLLFSSIVQNAGITKEQDSLSLTRLSWGECTSRSQVCSKIFFLFRYIFALFLTDKSCFDETTLAEYEPYAKYELLELLKKLTTGKCTFKHASCFQELYTSIHCW